jgi:hypothetical protein
MTAPPVFNLTGIAALLGRRSLRRAARRLYRAAAAQFSPEAREQRRQLGPTRYRYYAQHRDDIGDPPPGYGRDEHHRRP